jgi:polyhydroxybutyrate depolymerase
VTGGASSGGAASGGSSSGGSNSGGSNSGGSDSGGSDSGGSDSGGSGSGGDGTGGGLSMAVDPSPGCSAGSPTFTVPNGQVGYPDGYDGSTPVPVMFAFHGAGGNESSLRNLWDNTPIGEKYLMIYLKSSGSGWGLNADRSRVEAAYEAVTQDGCVDQNRVFAVGHSSGAQMIVQLLCDDYSDFDAVIPVASSVYCSSWDPVPVLNFHGLDDQERCAYGLDDCDGRKDIVPYYTSNGCEDTRLPADLDVGSSCSGNIDPGCVEFQGCSEPTFFCNHNDPQYGTSNHGVPCFATAAMMDFLGRFDP